MEPEQLSAWMDGELDSQQARDAAARVLSDPELHDRWQGWHLAGDALRSSSLAIRPSKLVSRVSVQLESEPLHMAHLAASRPSRVRGAGRSRLIYGGAIAAALAFVSLVAIAPQMQSNLDELVALAMPGSGGALVAQPLEPVMLSDPRLTELLEAHGSMSIRTVSEVR